MDEKELRTVVEFYKSEGWVRSMNLNFTIDGLAVGQDMTFDHPSMDRCLSGKIVKISHVVFLSDKAPLTYIDVEVGNDSLPGWMAGCRT